MTRRLRLVLGLSLAGLLGLSLLLAYLHGAYSSDFGAFDDEPAHVVTGIMVTRWLQSGLPAPLSFARDYYLHYPKVAVGQWPPMLYGLQGLWMLGAGIGTASLVTLLVVLATAVSAWVLRVLREEVGAWTALAAGVLFLLLPVVQHFGAIVMSELPLALFCSFAFWSFGRFLEAGQRSQLVAFGVWSFLAIMTKGNALALALVPPLAIVLGRRWDLLRSRGLWVLAVVMGAACAPWYVLSLRFTPSTWVESEPSLRYSSTALAFYGRGAFRLGGIGLALWAVIGLGQGLRAAPRERRGRWIALASWLVGWLVLHVVVPSSQDDRHLVLVAPAILVAAAAGAAFVVRRAGAPAWCAALLLVLPFAAERLELTRKDWHGYGTLAERLLGDPTLAGSAFLITSDGAGEGAFVAAVAVREPAPRHVVLRASKVLGSDDWLGRNYRPRFDSLEALGRWLEEVPVGVVVVDEGAKESQRFLHQDQLLELLRRPGGPWVEEAAVDLVRDGVTLPAGLRVFRLAGHEGRSVSLERVRAALQGGSAGFGS